MGMHCLPAFAKSSFIEGCLPICRRMPGILGMTHLYKKSGVGMSVCLSVRSGMHSWTVLSLVPSLPHPQKHIRIPKTPRKPVPAAVLTLQNGFICLFFFLCVTPNITVRSHFPSKPNKQGGKKYFPTKFSWGVGKFPALVGQSWQPQAGFADAGVGVSLSSV